MSTLRLKVRINPGRKGVAIGKLSKIGKEVERFLRMLAKDINIRSYGKEWLAIDFKNQSVAFTAEHQGLHTPAQIGDFNDALLFMISFDPEKEQRLNGYRRATVKQFAKIADPIDQDEEIRFGVLSKIGSNRAKWRSLDKIRARKIAGYVDETILCHGALQGTIHDLTVGVRPMQFDLRDLPSGALVKCHFEEDLYDDVIRALHDRNAVVHLSGMMKIHRIDQKIEHLKVEKIKPAEKYRQGDLEKFFGCAPNLTGDMSTSDYIESMRDNGNDSKDIY